MIIGCYARSRFDLRRPLWLLSSKYMPSRRRWSFDRSFVPKKLLSQVNNQRMLYQYVP